MEHRMLLTKSLNQTLKKRLAKSLVWSVLLYGSEAWTLKKDDIRRLESFEMWVWRRMEKISWTERVRNEEVLRRVGEERTLINTIWRRKARWTGHVIRSEGLLRTVIEGRAEGKRPRGRKRMMMLDDIKQGQTYHAMKRAALNREGWRRLTHAGPASGQNTWWWFPSILSVFEVAYFKKSFNEACVSKYTAPLKVQHLRKLLQNLVSSGTSFLQVPPWKNSEPPALYCGRYKTAGNRNSSVLSANSFIRTIWNWSKQ